jgi:hypothetical protein
MTDYPLAIPPDGIVRLATDLAMEIRTPAETFAEWGIGLPGQDPRADAIMENTAFREIYQQIQREWDGVTGTTQRVRLKSALIVEEALPAIYKMITATDGDHRLRLDAFKQLSKMSGVEDEAKKPSEAGEKFIVNIRIGGQDVASVEANMESAGPEAGRSGRTIEGSADPVPVPSFAGAWSDSPRPASTGDPPDGGINFNVFGT